MIPNFHINTAILQYRGVRMTRYFVFLALSVMSAVAFMIVSASYFKLSLYWMIAQLGMALLAAKIARFLNRFLFNKYTNVLYQVLLPFWFIQYILVQSGMPHLFAHMAILASGIAISVGRIGCLLQGCCHGIPGSWGVVYRHKLYSGPFIPVPLLESIWCMVWAVWGTTILDEPGALPGVVFITAYASGRFLIEFLRHKSDRLFWLGLSEAQWTSLIILITIAILYGW